MSKVPQQRQDKRFSTRCRASHSVTPIKRRRPSHSSHSTHPRFSLQRARLADRLICERPCPFPVKCIAPLDHHIPRSPRHEPVAGTEKKKLFLPTVSSPAPALSCLCDRRPALGQSQFLSTAVLSYLRYRTCSSCSRHNAGLRSAVLKGPGDAPALGLAELLLPRSPRAEDDIGITVRRCLRENGDGVEYHFRRDLLFGLGLLRY